MRYFWLTVPCLFFFGHVPFPEYSQTLKSCKRKYQSKNRKWGLAWTMLIIYRARFLGQKRKGTWMPFQKNGGRKKCETPTHTELASGCVTRPRQWYMVCAFARFSGGGIMWLRGHSEARRTEDYQRERPWLRLPAFCLNKAKSFSTDKRSAADG